MTNENRLAGASRFRITALGLKRRWAASLLPLLLLFTVPFEVKAQFNFVVNTNLTITITGYTGPDHGVAAVPSTISGLPVTTIADSAFANSTLAGLTLPDSVTSIGKQAVTSCQSLTNLTLGNSVTYIGDYAFGNCGGLTSVTLPNSLTNIADGVFGGCSGLTSFTIPDSVISIGTGCFSYCPSLGTVRIGKGLTTINGNGISNPFYHSGLTNFTVDPLNSTYSSFDGVLFDKTQTTLILYPVYRSGPYLIPNSVTTVGDFAFNYCLYVTGITMGNSVTNIGDSAFGNCSLLKIAMGNAVTRIGNAAFASSLLNNVAIPDSVTTLGMNAFDGDTYLTNVIIGRGVTNLQDYVFSATGLANVTIPYGVTTIGNAAFYQDFWLTSISIASSVASIGVSAFSGCGALSDALSIPDSVVTIGLTAFSRCPRLKSIAIGNGVTWIGPEAFQYCSSLTNVTLGDSIGFIGASAFLNCGNLAGVYFQGNAPSLGDSAVFSGAGQSIIYYLPGTTGWGPIFGDRPTIPWQLPYPLILNSGPGFGVQSNQFGFTVSWATNRSVVVEGSSNLGNSTWIPLQTNTFTSGSFHFSDPQWTNYPNRFYRIRSP